MAPRQPMLGDLELPQVREIEAGGERSRARHEVPGLEGDFLQDLGRRGTRIELAGVLTGPASGAELARLRDRFRAAEPVPFVSDIASATRVGDVVIEDLAVRELAGRPERFAYAVTLREHTETPAVSEEEAPEIPVPPPPVEDVGTLVVEVTVDGGTEFDFSRVTVSVQGVSGEALDLSRTLTRRAGNVWTEEGLRPGGYAVDAVTTETPAMAAAGAADVRSGETAEVRLDLRSVRAVTKVFVVHFRFDKAFIEPCMRTVLRQVAEHSGRNPREKLLIVGHTDKAGSRAYNQSLSERRARGAFAYLTHGLGPAAAAEAEAEWNDLRRTRPAAELPSVKDSWAAREYQHMLQDLGFYSGNVDGRHGGGTDEAVEAYRCHENLPPGTQVDDRVWEALIHDYLAKDPQAIPPGRFFRNAGDGCDGGILKWLGCGEDDAKKNTDCAFRPSRRTEILFVDGAALPCEVPEPVTLRMPAERPAATVWCLGPGDPEKRCCFVVPADPDRRDPEKDEGKLGRPAPAPTLTVSGSIVLQDPIRRVPDVPFANKKILLTAADGTIRPAEPCHGEPQPGRTDGSGRFSFPDLPAGVYTLEVREQVVARLLENENDPLLGNVVCKEIASASDRLDVAVEATQLRLIRLPLVAHLMTQVMEDADGNAEVRSDVVSESDLRAAFPVVNFLWGQARIEFELVNVARAVYRPLRQFDLDDQEFSFLLESCAYPNVVNVFFVESVAGSLPPQNGEPGIGRAEEDGVDAPGCALGLLFDPALTLWLAHELGHFLNLDDVTGVERLMAEGLANPGSQLTSGEAETARASRGAARECVRLALAVRGATPFGGPRSPNHVAIRNAAEAVVVEAEIDPEILALGTLVMEGGVEVPGNPLERRVPRAELGKTVVEATFSLTRARPQGPVTEVHRDRANVFVVDFTLEVPGATPCPPGGNAFVVRAASEAVAVRARFAAGATLPACKSRDFVRWEGGEEHPFDPFLRNVPRAMADRVEVRATVADLTRSVVLRVTDVRFLALGSSTPLAELRIEGILAAQQQGLRRDRLAARQQSALFRVRTELPGVTAGAVTATLTAGAADGTALPEVTVELRRQADGRFESPPDLAFLLVPVTTGLADVTVAEPDRLRLLPATAGGTLRCEIRGELCGFPSAVAATRGRVVQLFIQGFTNAGQTAGVTAQDVRGHLRRAQEVWAQAGIEVRERALDLAVPDPGGLLDLRRNTGPDALLTDEERRLLRAHPDCETNPGSCPAKSGVETDLNVYYLREIGGAAIGRSYGGFSVIVVEGPNALVTTLAHEIGHKLLVSWPCTTPDADGDHRDPRCNPWPAENIMAQAAAPENRRAVDRSQADNVLAPSPHPFVVVEPPEESP